MSNDFTRLTEAAEFAARKHAGQFRKGQQQEPYVNHVLEVANILTHSRQTDVDLLLAALLHDVVEDSDATESGIREKFGESAASLVLEVTDDPSLSEEERRQRQVDHAPHLSDKAKRLKLADKISNISHITEHRPDGWSNEQCLEYVCWGERVAAGLRGVADDLDRQFDDVCALARQRFGKRTRE